MEKTALLVLGMHRSGTSALGGALARLGVEPPKTLLQADSTNERGYFESIEIMRLNDLILASAGSAWDDWRAFNGSWLKSSTAESFKPKAIELIESEFEAANFLFIKDPRLCRIAPFWIGVLEAAGYTVKMIIPVRSPVEVARSLWQRNDFPKTKSLLLWLRHVLDAELLSRNYPRAILSSSEFLADWSCALTRASQQLGVPWPRYSDRAAAEIDAFLSPSLRHHHATLADLHSHPEINDWVRVAYDAMTELVINPASESGIRSIDQTRLEFERACIAFGRVALEYETRMNQLAEETRNMAARLDRANADLARLTAQAESIAAARDMFAVERHALAEKLSNALAERDRLAAEADRKLSAEPIPSEQNG
jgi:hypothetical protein